MVKKNFAEQMQQDLSKNPSDLSLELIALQAEAKRLDTKPDTDDVRGQITAKALALNQAKLRQSPLRSYALSDGELSKTHEVIRSEIASLQTKLSELKIKIDLGENSKKQFETLKQNIELGAKSKKEFDLISQHIDAKRYCLQLKQNQ